MLRVLVTGTPKYLKSFPRYKFLFWNTYHPNTLYLREEGCEDRWLFFEAQRGPLPKQNREIQGYGRVEDGHQNDWINKSRSSLNTRSHSRMYSIPD